MAGSVWKFGSVRAVERGTPLERDHPNWSDRADVNLVESLRPSAAPILVAQVADGAGSLGATAAAVFYGHDRSMPFNISQGSPPYAPYALASVCSRHWLLRGSGWRRG